MTFKDIKPGMVAVAGSHEYKIIKQVKRGDLYKGIPLENRVGCKFWAEHSGEKVLLCFDSLSDFNNMFPTEKQPCS